MTTHRTVSTTATNDRFRRLVLVLASLPIALLLAAARVDAQVQAEVIGNLLLVTGDRAANLIDLQLQSGNSSRIAVRDGSRIVGTFSRNTFTTIVVDGEEGNDSIHLNPVFGPITEPALIDGGSGNDTLIGGHGHDRLNGAGGDDTIVWGTARGNDIVDGGGGLDTLFVEASDAAETISVGPSVNPAGRVQVNSDAGFILDISTTEGLVVNARDGNDRVVASDLPSPIILTFDGGDGDDELRGANGPDTLIGGDGNDTLSGAGSADVIVAGPGDDAIDWKSGDGSDDIDAGEGGLDILRFRGDDANERIELANVNGRVHLTHDAVNVDVLLLGGLERLEVQSFGGDDVITAAGDPKIARIEIDAGEGADVVTTNTAFSAIAVNGGAGSDRLRFGANGEPVTVTPNTIVRTSKDGVHVTHREFEDVQFFDLLGLLPSIAITSPTTAATTTAVTSFIGLAGTAADAEGIAAITMAHDPGGSVTVSGTTTWTTPPLPLAIGANVFTATVRDTDGNEVSDTLLVTLTELSYTMAEGATGGFFDTDILLANPNVVEARIAITYLKGDGTTVPQTLTLPPLSRRTISVDRIAGLENAEVSATVTSTAALPIVVERTMRWDATGYGAHTEKATDGPATRWFFAEGAQGFFDTYLLLANPQPATNTATVTFLLEDGVPEVKTFTLTPTSRRTVAINGLPEIVGRAFGMIVAFAQPGVAERAMYFGSPVFNAGHESAGVNAPATSWFLAEGATGSFFTTFVLLANPGTAEATATVTFLPETGRAVTKTHSVPAGGRVTLNIATEDPSLASSAVATAVQSTQPILVERAQYWPFTPDRWYEAHNAFGSTAIGTRWGLAEGRVGGAEGYQTFILLANADPRQAAEVRITFLRETGTPVVRTFTVNPTSRLNVQANSIADLANQSFGALIEVTSGPGIFVERALYSDAQGVVFAAGTNALATRLP